MKDYTKRNHFRPKWWQALCWIVVFWLFISFISNPSLTAHSALEGCTTALKAVLPSTFPYLVLSSILASSGFCQFLGNSFSFMAKLLNIPPACVSVIPVSILCGFPIGGAMTSRLYEEGLCTKEQAERLICFCNFCGPPYIFGMIGNTVMKNSLYGLIAFSVQTVAALFLGIILGKTGQKTNFSSQKEETESSVSISELICSSICKAGASTVNIFAYIIFFSVLCGMITNIFKLPSPLLRGMLFGIIEISNGMNHLKSCNSNIITYFFACFITYFSGFSVHLQVISTLNTDISPKKYLLSRLLFAPICAFLSSAVCMLIL